MPNHTNPNDQLLMSEPLQLPPGLLQALLQSPEKRLTLIQGQHQISIQLLPTAQIDTTSPSPFTPPPPSRMKLQLLDDAAAPIPNDAPITPAPPASTNTAKVSLKKAKRGDALRTMSDMSGITPVDFLSMLSEEEKAKADVYISSFPTSLTPAAPTKAPDQSLEIIQDNIEIAPLEIVPLEIAPLEIAPLEAAPADEPPVIVGKSLEDTQPDPEEAEATLASLSSSFQNAFLDDNDDSWQVLPGSAFRMLRTSDTPKVLGFLFSRLASPVNLLEDLLPLTNSQLSSSHLAKAAGVTALLPKPIPFAYSAEVPPKYHLVGQTRDQSYVLLYQEEADETLHFAPVPHDGGELQIALVEGETLLTDLELTRLFKEGAREATPEQAEATAKQLQKKLSQKAEDLGRHGERPFALSPVTNQKPRGLERAIPVNERLLKRLEFNRTMDQEHLWDETLQPGVAIFRYNLATLFEHERPMLEGILLCILANRQYLVFDRRSKQTVPLNPHGNQSIWLRHDERLV